MSSIQCPKCGAEIFNNYGYTKNGKQRLRCLICSRQFIAGDPRKEISKRPACPVCGGKMYVHTDNVASTRFRCAAYPTCCGYSKISKET